MAGRADPADAAAFEEAARQAFLAGTPLDVPKPFEPASSAEPMRTPGVRPLGTVARAGAPQAEPGRTPAAWLVSGARDETLESRAAPAAEGATHDRLPDRNEYNVGSPSLDLLRAPASVTPVADDFFDGLIRRVERDR